MDKAASNHKLTPEQIETIGQIKNGDFTERDRREANARALVCCCDEDAKILASSAERIVAYIKSKNPKIQISVDGALEILSALGIFLMTPNGNSYIQDIELENRNVNERKYFTSERR